MTIVMLSGFAFEANEMARQANASTEETN